MALVKGKIIKILSDKALVVNVGTKNGIKVNDILHIIHKGEEITDLDGNESLGLLEYVKAAVRVSHVQETMSTCVPLSVSKETSVSSSLYRTVSSDMARIAMEKSPYSESSDTFDVKHSDISGMPQIPPVGVGDEVVAVNVEATGA